MSEYHFLPEKDILAPKAYTVYNITNSWWIVHPEKGLAFYGKGYSHPQCNKNKDITECIGKACMTWAQIKFFERVLAPLDLKDYKE